ncbi:unnamed protein product [Ilex paraguariensis]|uniref:Protein kish n=1 Tax=Ilex paraguariensis TaxID=185542 RepID=A0ABC8RR47_9AQUA
MSALFNFHSFLTVVLLVICTCTFLKMQFPALFEQKTGYVRFSPSKVYTHMGILFLYAFTNGQVMAMLLHYKFSGGSGRIFMFSSSISELCLQLDMNESYVYGCIQRNMLIVDAFRMNMELGEPPPE